MPVLQIIFLEGPPSHGLWASLRPQGSQSLVLLGELSGSTLKPMG